MGLTQKILLFTSLLVVALVAATVGYTSAEAEQLAQANLRRALQDTERFWEGFQADRYVKLKLGLGVLGNDPAFKAAVQTDDPATVQDLLQERGVDLGADFFIATNAAGLVIARTDRPGARGQDLSEDPVVRRPLEGDRSSATVWRLGDTLYQAVSVPMRFGTTLVGVLIAGYQMNSGLAAQIQRLTHSEVAYLIRLPGEPPQVSASSLGPAEAALREALRLTGVPVARAGIPTPFEIDLAGSRQIAVEIPLKSAGNEDVGSMLVLRSLSEARASFDRFRSSLILVSIVVMILGLVTAYLGASRITGPLSRLVDLVERVRQGSYSGAVEIATRDEIGTLASAFDRMREGIATREDQIRRMALQDPLTGLANRALFNDRLQHAFSLSRRGDTRLAVLMLDLDRFKDVNDTLGHPAGDRVLREVGARLTSSLRSSDTVARLGGDEFAILLPGAGNETARRIARKILRALAAPIVVEDHGLHIYASMGIAVSPEHGEDAETLVRNADTAMYGAKRASSGVAAYDPTQDPKRQNRLWLVGDLRQAIEGNQLTLHYQPKSDLKTGTVGHVEALVRWNHPVRGLIPPGEFVPLAEQTGLVKLLTRWVLKEALRQCGRWRERSSPLSVAVNVSARDLLLNSELPGVMSDLIRACRIEPEWVGLEITESAIMEDPAQAHVVLQQIRDLGVGLSIDDFGTGYSSLAYLKKLPVNELKIDQSFVTGMVQDKDNRTLVRSMVELGHNMGLTVVAEGVESADAWQLLRQLDCDMAQGYFLSPPLAPRELEEWLARARPGAAGVA